MFAEDWLLIVILPVFISSILLISLISLSREFQAAIAVLPRLRLTPECARSFHASARCCAVRARRAFARCDARATPPASAFSAAKRR